MAIKLEAGRIGCYDIETASWDQFVMGGYLGPDGAYREESWRDEEGFASHLLHCGDQLWAHNGGQFDHRWLLDHAAQRGLQARLTQAGGRLIMAQLETGTVLVDSYALAQCGLETLAKGSIHEKQRLDLPCSCGEECGGYCLISRKIKIGSRLWKIIAEYLCADVRALEHGLKRIFDFAEAHGLQLGPSAASTGWRSLRRTYDPPRADLTASEFTFARAALYGGKCEIYVEGSPVARGYDLSSSYPAQLAEIGLDVGPRRHLFGAAARRAYEGGNRGIYSARVKVPELARPPLPYRSEATKRVFYPSGSWSGVWTGIDLRRAERMGSRVEIDSGLLWCEEPLDVSGWVRRLYALRAQASPGVSSFLKGILNGVVGKFGAGRDLEVLELWPKNLYKCHGRGRCRTKRQIDCGECCEIHCSGACGASKFLSDFLVSRRRYVSSASGYTGTAAHVLAKGRDVLEELCQSVERSGGRVLYADTDGIYTTSEELPELVTTAAGELGAARDLGVVFDFHAFAPKVYQHRTAPTDDARWTVRARGIKLRERHRDLKHELAAVMTQGRGIIGLRAVGAAHRFFKRNHTIPKLTPSPGARLWSGETLPGLAGPRVTRAYTVEELRRGGS